MTGTRGVRRGILAVGCLLLAVSACLLPGSVSAYFADTDSAGNQMTAAGNRIEIEEEFPPPEDVTPGSEFTKKVSEKNVGTSTCYVRIRAVFSDSNAGQYCTVDWNTEDYVCGDDGYYYYRRLLRPGETTPYLFTTVTVSPEAPSEALERFSILVYAESCQAAGCGSFGEAWQYFGRNRP